MATNLLSQEECKTLEDDGIFLPCLVQGKREISGSFLWTSSTPSSSSAGGSVSSTTTVSYHHSKIQQDIDLPEKLESAAALEFIGLKAETTKDIYDRWSSRPDPKRNPDDLLDYVYGHTTQLRKNSWDYHTDEQALARLGVAQWLQDAILRPEYADIYRTNTLKFWLDESFRANFNSLIRIQSQLKAYVTAHGRGNNRPERGSISDIFPTTTAATAAAASSSSNPVADLMPRVTALSMASESNHLPQPHVSIENAQLILGDHDVYYKAKAVDEMGDDDDDLFITSDGSVNMSAIQTWAGGDFNPQGPAWYWSPELETAHKYKGYAENRMPASEQWIIRIQIPKEFSQRLKKEELWYSPNWKEYVWYCKKKKMKLPQEFEKYFKPGKDQTDVMVGHIYTGVTRVFAKIPKDQIQTSISEDDVLRIGNEKAKQWVIMHSDVAENLGLEIRGKMHIDVFTSKGPTEQ